jgi:VIT1/CCC1 family predicted Fe2+/Mn2+ transporter
MRVRAILTPAAQERLPPMVENDRMRRSHRYRAQTSGMPQEGSKLFAERARIERLSRVRELVFGSLDGLIVPLGVVSGVAGGTGDSRAVIVAGVAEAFAGALSMGAGEFIAARAEAQVQTTEVQKELEEMRSAPDFERRELAQIYEHDGVSPADAQLLVDTLSRYPQAYQTAMVGKELGISTLEPETVKVPEALTIGASYLVGSIFPLIAYFFLPIEQALPVSLVLTFIALVVVGYIKGKLASMNLMRSILEIVAVGVLSAAGGYILGTLVPHLFGY